MHLSLHSTDDTEENTLWTVVVTRNTEITVKKKLEIGSSPFISILVFFYFAVALSSLWPPHCLGFTITLRCITIIRTSLDEWSARRRDPYLTTLTTDIHAPGGIRIRNPSKREASDPRPRPPATGISRPRDYCWKFCSPVRIFEVLTVEVPQV